MSIARIHKPCKPATQSGRGKTKDWVLEYRNTDRKIDEIMGWTGSSDTYAQEVKLNFESLEKAIAYANKYGIEYEVIQPVENSKPKLRAYSSIFKKGSR